MHILLPLDVN